MLPRYFAGSGWGSTGFWQSVAAPPADDAIRPGAKLKHAFEQLGGVYAAFAQFLLWRADLLDADYLNALRQTRCIFPPVSRDEAAALLRGELGELSEGGDGLVRRMEEEPVWSTVSRTAYLSWYREKLVVIQVAREPISESALAEFEKGIAHLAHPDVDRVKAPRILKEFRQWLRHGDSIALERSYLQVLGRSRGDTAVDYPTLIPELSTDKVLCWPWVEGESAGSLLLRGSVDAVSRLAVAVLEQFCSLSVIDADLQPDAIVMPTGGNRLVIRRIGRALSVPPPAVNVGMKYMAAVLEGNASMTVQTLLTLAAGQSTATLETDLLNRLSGVEPELKVHAWYPESAAAFESNWRALANLQISRPRPLYLDCLHRNLIALGYWTSDAVAAGGKATDTIAEAQWPVLERVLRSSASQFLNPAVVTEWSAGIGLLTFGAMREANRLAEELRENNLSLEVAPELDLEEPDDKDRPGFRLGLLACVLLIALLGSLRWGSSLREPAPAVILALGALIALFWLVAKID